LIGVGYDGQRQVTASLYDVSDPDAPTVLERTPLGGYYTPADSDPHALLWWAPYHVLLVVVQGAEGAGSLRAGPSGTSVSKVATVDARSDGLKLAYSFTHVHQAGAADSGIQRALVIGPHVWTFSARGVLVSLSLERFPRGLGPQRLGPTGRSVTPAGRAPRPINRVTRVQKVLIANRGEIACRIARACRDAGLASVAVYAEPDVDALHVRIADEAYALGGTTPGDSYLVIDKVLDVAKRSGADAVHPGYGFLSENAEFAQAVIDAGLTWIGPPPGAIASLGDKTAARHIAMKVGAPLAPGTADPVKGVDEVIAFAQEHGVPGRHQGGVRRRRSRAQGGPHHGGDPRALRVRGSRGHRRVRPGECFVERYLDRPRHVETQILADRDGNVVVVGTRDCSLQRRYQKLVEEAPAPYLSDAQNKAIYDASKAICKEAGYVGAGTCEFLVAPDGLISFLEVNTRLQVEHPVTEEVSGWDLVRWQFALADGASLAASRTPSRAGTRSSTASTVRTPAATSCRPPAPSRASSPRRAPGVRVDTGVESGSVIGGAFDRCLRRSSSSVLPEPRRSSARGACSTRPSSTAWPPCCPFHARSCATRRSPPATTSRRSRCTTAGSRPSGSTRSSRSPAAPTPRSSRRARAHHGRGRRQASSRSFCPRASAPAPPPRRRRPRLARPARAQRRP